MKGEVFAYVGLSQNIKDLKDLKDLLPSRLVLYCLLRSRWWTLGRSTAPRSFPLIESVLVPEVSPFVKTVTIKTRSTGRPCGMCWELIRGLFCVTPQKCGVPGAMMWV